MPELNMIQDNPYKYNRSEANVLGAKNLLQNKASTTESNGIIWTVNTDGTMTTSGTTGTTQSEIDLNKYFKFTHIGKYIISGAPVGNNNENHWMFGIYDKDTREWLAWDKTGSGAEFTIDASRLSHTFNTNCVVRKNESAPSGVWKPMIRLASDTDSTWQPYAETNYQLTQNKMSYKDNGVLGAKNRLKYTLADAKKNSTSGTWSNNVYTVGNLTITVNDDMTVKLNGSHTSDVTMVLHGRTDADNCIEAGTYKFLAENAENNYFVRYFTTRSGSAYIYGNINSSTPSFTADVRATDAIGVLINYTANTSISNVTIKPMIVLPSDTDTTYRPYAMTNKDLTDALAKTEYSDLGYSIKGIKKGNVVCLTFDYMTSAPAVNAGATIIQLPAALKPPFIFSFLEAANSRRMTIDTNGNLSCESNITSSFTIRGSVTYVAL